MSTTSSESEVRAVVIDNGSHLMKAGFAGDEAPQSIFPSVVGWSEQLAGVSSYSEGRKCYVGACAQSLQSIGCPLSHPMDHGIVTNWEAMEQIWHHIFYNELHIAPEETPVLMTESPASAYGPKANREKMTEVMFETFLVPSMYVSVDALMGHMASGRCKGVVVQSGLDVTWAVPTYEHYVLPHAVQRMDIGGRELTNKLLELLKQRGYKHNAQNMDCIRNIKEVHCHVALATAGHSTEESTYETPDGQTLTIGDEWSRCPEAMFQPLGQVSGIQELCFNSVFRCDPYIRRDLYANVVIGGGNTMFSEFAERLEQEVDVQINLNIASGAGFKTKVCAPKGRQYLAWIGGSCLASLGTFYSLSVTKAEYDEAGPSIIHRKCC